MSRGQSVRWRASVKGQSVRWRASVKGAVSEVEG